MSCSGVVMVLILLENDAMVRLKNNRLDCIGEMIVIDFQNVTWSGSMKNLNFNTYKAIIYPHKKFKTNSIPAVTVLASS